MKYPNTKSTKWYILQNKFPAKSLLNLKVRPVVDGNLSDKFAFMVTIAIFRNLG